MEKNNRVLILSSMLLLLVAFTIRACANTKNMKIDKTGYRINFPINETGYPQKDIVLINGEIYSLLDIKRAYSESHIEHQIELKKSESTNKIQVVLPRISPIELWSMEENMNIDLISYSKIKLHISDKQMVDGESSEIQKFEFNIDPNNMEDILFKWSNVNETGKSFKDKKANYFLRIKVSH